jgi:hypothetical protein
VRVTPSNPNRRLPPRRPPSHPDQHPARPTPMPGDPKILRWEVWIRRLRNDGIEINSKRIQDEGHESRLTESGSERRLGVNYPALLFGGLPSLVLPVTSTLPTSIGRRWFQSFAYLSGDSWHGDPDSSSVCLVKVQAVVEVHR